MEKVISFDRHAKRRMKWRKISEAEVISVLKEPEKMEPTIYGRINVFKTMGSRYLKVTYKEFESELLVISAVDKSD